MSQGRASWPHSKLAATYVKLKWTDQHHGQGQVLSPSSRPSAQAWAFLAAPNTAVTASAKFWPLHPHGLTLNGLAVSSLSLCPGPKLRLVMDSRKNMRDTRVGKDVTDVQNL